VHGKKAIHMLRATVNGQLFQINSAEEVWHEIRQVWKAGSGISYPSIEQAGV
jgi:hypothetical protein